MEEVQDWPRSGEHFASNQIAGDGLAVELTAKGTKLDEGDMVQQLTEMAAYGIIGGAAFAGLFGATKAKSRIVDDLVVNMVDVGEETGELDTMLYKVADTYDEQVETTVTSVTALLEPLLILVMVGIVLVIILATLMPLLQITNSLA